MYVPSYSLIFLRRNDDLRVFGRDPLKVTTSGNDCLRLRDAEDLAEDEDRSLFVGEPSPEPLVRDERLDEDIRGRDLFERNDNFRRS